MAFRGFCIWTLHIYIQYVFVCVLYVFLFLYLLEIYIAEKTTPIAISWILCGNLLLSFRNDVVKFIELFSFLLFNVLCIVLIMWLQRLYSETYGLTAALRRNKCHLKWTNLHSYAFIPKWLSYYCVYNNFKENIKYKGKTLVQITVMHQHNCSGEYTACS